MNTISLSEFSLPFAASCIMNYKKPLMKVIGNTVYLGYLSDDHDTENPLESCDGMGRIYTCHRHSSTLSDYEDALAIQTEGWDSYNSEEWLTQHASVFKRYWIEAALKSAAFENWALNTATARKNDDLSKYLRYRARKLLTEVGFESSFDVMTVWDFDFTETAFEAALKELREHGLVGDPHAVLLDVYSHSGECWSLAGHGMQCRWDTAGGAGVWVPDDEARKEIVRRSKPYTIGYITGNTLGGKQRYWANLDSGCKSPEFAEWYQAFSWLETRFKSREKRSLTKAQLRHGEMRAAREIASSVLEEYNAWLAGDCYGRVIVSFDSHGDFSDPSSWDEISSDECWGYIGSDWAYADLESEFNAHIEFESSQKAMVPAGMLPATMNQQSTQL